MVKPLNKEWALFGPRYRVAGAKGDKVDCNACQKQVSAAVNRLQSHLRVCPAHPDVPPGAIGPSSYTHFHRAAKLEPAASSSVATSSSADLTHALPESTALSPVLPTEPAVAATNSATRPNDAAPAAKKPRHSPEPPRDRASTPAPHTVANMEAMDELWFNPNVPSLGSNATGSTPPTTCSASPGASFAKKRLEMEEKRLLLEIQRDEREQRREQFNLRILEAQARKEWLLADKEGVEAKVQLALARKRLRDEGVANEEIERLLPLDRDAKGSNELEAERNTNEGTSGHTASPARASASSVL